jgi:hypothetical protein
MSRVRIRRFGPSDNPNEVSHLMNGFLSQSHIKYVSHTYSVLPNTEENLAMFKKEFRRNREHLYFGSLAYYAKEEKGEKKEKKD